MAPELHKESLAGTTLPLSRHPEKVTANSAANPPPVAASTPTSQVRHLNIEAESQRVRRRRRKHGRARREELTLLVLSQHYPEVFGKQAGIKPLAIGIHKQIEKDCEAGVVALSPIQVRYALMYWTRRPAYLRKLIEGASRVNLQGRAEGVVTKEDADHAQVLLVEQAAARTAAKDRAKTPSPPKP